MICTPPPPPLGEKYVLHPRLALSGNSQAALPPPSGLAPEALDELCEPSFLFILRKIRAGTGRGYTRDRLRRNFLEVLLP